MKKNESYKNVADSETIKTEVVCPNDANPMGLLQGGRLVEWMDIGAAVCAQTHSGKICVTASINQVDFNAQGLNVAMDNKSEVYLRLSAHYRALFDSETKSFKMYLNTEEAWGESFSPYARINDFMFRS